MLEITNNIISVTRTTESGGKKTFNTSVITGVEVYMYKGKYEDYISFGEVSSSLNPHNLIISVDSGYIPLENDLITDKNGNKWLIKDVELIEPDGEFYNFYQCIIFQEV